MTLAGTGTAGPGSTASWGLAENRANCGSIERTVSLDFGEWAYLVLTMGAAALGLAFGLESAAAAGSAIDAVVFDKATLAMG